MRKVGAPRRLRTRILFLQLGIVLGVLVLVSAVVMSVEVGRVERAAFDRTQSVARELADLPVIQAGMASADPTAVIAPVAELSTAVSGVYYITVADMDGIRVAHLDPNLIGLPVSSEHELVRQGESFLGVEEGPLGLTLRAKEPIYYAGEVVGTVSVGILQSTVRANLTTVVWGFAPWILLAAAIGTVGAGLASRLVYRIYGVAPEQIGGLLQANEAVLYSIDEGVLGVDPEGTLTLINKEAQRLLGLSPQEVGKPASEVLEESVARLLESADPSAEGVQTVLAGERVLIATRREAQLGARSYGRTLTLKDRTELENNLRELRGQKSLTDTLRAQAHEFTNRLHLVSGLLSLGEVEEAHDHIKRYTGMAGPGTDRLVDDPMMAALCNAQLAVAREAGVEFWVDENSKTSADWRSDEDAVTVAANLLTNAIEAAGDGGKVVFRINANSAGVRIAVGDSGPGIPSEEFSHLVELGYSSKRGPGQPLHARGIGLTLVDRIITRRGGQLKAGSSELGGASIVAAWPLQVSSGAPRTDYESAGNEDG